MTTKQPSTFAFVPQRAKSDPTGPDDRRFINTHLSRLAAERRKRGKAKPRSSEPSQKSPNLTKPSVSHAPKKGGDSPSTASVTPSEQAVASTSPATDDFESVDTPPDPLTVLDNGSHDPFDSTLIPITPEVRKLLAFDHDIFHPWGEGLERGDRKSSAFINKFALTTCEAMTDKTTGYANLARLATAAACITSDSAMSVAAVDFKTRAYAGLRESLIANGMAPNMLMLTQMFSLLSMELAGHNSIPASLHANTLQRLIQNNRGADIDAVEMNRKLLCAILWHECLRGSFSLCRPVFDIEKLIDHEPFIQTLLESKKNLLSMGYFPPKYPDGFRQAGVPPELLLRVRELRFLSDLGYALKRAPESITEEIMSAFSFRATLTSSKLLEVYNDFVDEIKARLGQSSESEDLSLLYQNSAAALAARYWYRVATSHEAVDIEPTPHSHFYKIYGTQKPVIEHLREAFYYCSKTGAVEKSPKLWLWILRVGTLAERADMHPCNDPARYVNACCHQAFMRHARSMGLESAVEVEKVLKMFLYSDQVGPMSRIYFNQANAATLKGSR